MRIGVFGGTFDPVHLAHLVLAEQCREQARLDRVLFIPAARPPHKLTRPLTPFHHRAEMLRLAVAGYPPFQVSEVEHDRPGPSYTADTLRELRQQHPGDEFFLLIGSDTLAELPTWYQPEAIVAQATLLVVVRPDHPLPAQGPFPYQPVQTPLLAIASRDLRRRVAEGRTIRYLVPRAVECYIATHRLYQPAGDPSA
jgi:nicotinate-nucleotide adenylyltransferase